MLRDWKKAGASRNSHVTSAYSGQFMNLPYCVAEGAVGGSAGYSRFTITYNLKSGGFGSLSFCLGIEKDRGLLVECRQRMYGGELRWLRLIGSMLGRSISLH